MPFFQHVEYAPGVSRHFGWQLIPDVPGVLSPVFVGMKPVFYVKSEDVHGVIQYMCRMK